MHALLFLTIRPPPISTLFPYTTLFRSLSLLRPHLTKSNYGELITLAAGKSKKDRKSTRLNSSHLGTSYAVLCLKKKTKSTHTQSCRGKRRRMRSVTVCQRLQTKPTGS